MDLKLSVLLVTQEERVKTEFPNLSEREGGGKKGWFYGRGKLMHAHVRMHKHRGP